MKSKSILRAATAVAALTAMAAPAPASASPSTSTRATADCLVELPFIGCVVPRPQLGPSTLDGTAEEGQQLACANQVPWPIDGLPRTYKFRRDGSQVQSGSSPHYDLTAADVHTTITCIVTVTGVFDTPFGPVNLGSISSPSSPGKGPVTALPLNLVSKPSVSGNAEEGQNVTCAQGTWSPADPSRSYEWLRDGSQVGTGQSYSVSTADVGHQLACRERVERLGRSNSADSSPVGVAAAPLQNTSLPSISGGSQEGQTLTCDPGSWTPNPAARSYEWLRNGNAVASGSSYQLGASDVGQLIRCRENVSRLGRNGSAQSSQISVVGKPVVRDPEPQQPPAGNPGNTGQQAPQGNPGLAQAKKLAALKKKRAAAIKKCNKRYKKKAQSKKRAACVKKAKKKYALK